MNEKLYKHRDDTRNKEYQMSQQEKKPWLELSIWGGMDAWKQEAKSPGLSVRDIPQRFIIQKKS